LAVAQPGQTIIVQRLIFFCSHSLGRSPLLASRNGIMVLGNKPCNSPIRPPLKSELVINFRCDKSTIWMIPN
jgi:hypothetical protein